MTTIHRPLPHASTSPNPIDFYRLNFVISSPRGGAISFSNRMSQLGQIGLPHTHLPIRSDSKHLKQVNSILDLYSIDDGLIRALSRIIYGGFETYQLEAAHHDLSMMYSRDTFGQVYQRLLANSSCNLYDPSLSLALFPDEIPQLESHYPGARYIYLFRDPYFYASSILTTIHGLDSLLIWWSIAKEFHSDIALDPLIMWCSINESLLVSKDKHRTASSVHVMRHPEATGRYSFERINQFIGSEYASYEPPLTRSSPSTFVTSLFKRRMSMSTRLSNMTSIVSGTTISPIQDKTSWWLDITLGGDPSANLSYHSNPGEIVPDYWKQIMHNSELIDRCDKLCRALRFTPLSTRLSTNE